jgi:hypothetical protein
MPIHQQSPVAFTPSRKVFIYRLTLSLAALLFFNHPTCAQELITKGPIQLTLPTPDWEETEPPAEIMATYEKHKIPVKMIFHAVSPRSELRFFIIRYDFPTQQDLDVQFAGYLDGVRRRCARQTTGEVSEASGDYHGLPYKSVSAALPGGMFLEIRIVFCHDHLYLLEMGGLAKSRPEAKQCLDNITFSGEAPPLLGTSGGIDQIHERTTGTTAAYERGRKLGRLLAFCLFGGLVAVIVLLIIRQWMPGRSVNPIRTGQSPTPPPLPAKAPPRLNKPEDSTR